ncbi:AtpZ/AtpI family protein [Oceaniglobus ichthyenteri]|uniref:AtpZ/AtpI family protein n=1 Tax=Oceaniglobus ichthyenteri TaxID=2136177 RepID=UPI001F0B9381|nr:AtpZ/AtpI family protein [Oceaniglobus ichthyenteri]
MEDDPHTARLKTLEDRIAAAKKANAPPERADENYSMANTAWRMVIELVAGLGIGFGIGYGLDVLFGTIPIFMLVFMGLGLAAGVKTMMRTAKELQDKAISAAGTDPDAEDKGN